MRLYYDELIAACHMAKHFGVEFTSEKGMKLTHKRYLTSFSSVEYPEALFNGNEFYVAEESVGIFTPIAGDMVESGGYIGYCEILDGKLVIKYQTNPSVFCLIQKNYKIIQRWGRPFFEPSRADS